MDIPTELLLITERNCMEDKYKHDIDLLGRFNYVGVDS